MPENILEKIIKNKTEKIEKLKKTISSETLNNFIKANDNFINFKGKVEDNIRDNKFDKPVFLHCITKKGKGYSPAEKSEDKYHEIQCSEQKL